MDNESKSEIEREEAIAEREKTIVRTGVIGIAANVLLASAKAVIGILTRSIAVTLDAVNNLTDALSSIVTIIGAKLSVRRPDKEHPLGHGRVEYISAMLVSVIVLYAGVTSLIEAVKKIFSPEKPDYSVFSLVFFGFAIAVKLALGFYCKKVGKRVHSSALSASGTDALFDAVISASVLACALVFILTELSLEAYVGALISRMIIRSGIKMLKDTFDDILGKRADEELTKQIKAILNEEPDVRGAYDLFINNYGPDRNYASVHLELPDTMTVEDVDKLTRRVQKKVFLDTGVILTGVGVYSYNTSDDEASRMRNEVLEKVLSHDWALQVHGFHADCVSKEIRFDVVISFEVDKKEALKSLYEEITAMYPEYFVEIVPDVDATD